MIKSSDAPGTRDEVLGYTPGDGNFARGNYFAEMCSDSEVGSYLRLIDLFITQF